MAILPVLLPLPFDEPFDYETHDATVEEGQFVRVPFGPRLVIGVVWHEPPKKRAPVEKLRAINQAIPLPAMPLEIRKLVAETAASTLMPLGNVLRLAMSVPGVFEPQPAKVGLVASPHATTAKLTAKRQAVLDACSPAGPLTASDLAKRANVTASVVRAMAADGLLERVEIEERFDAHVGYQFDPVALSDVQILVAEACSDAVRQSTFQELLIEGVPGSGKTEVYFQAIGAALQQGKRALVLLPEIALEAQWLDRFERSFSGLPIAWHSGLTASQRRRNWLTVAHGGASVVVGARSALFLPIQDLGVIVVDEEHDPSFKQEDGTLYHARDVAITRARIANCPILLASATPSIETAKRVGAIPGYAPVSAEHRHFMLPARHGGAKMPAIGLIDLRRDRLPRGRFLSEEARQAIASTLEANQQVMLFLNRRGYAPLTICRACGFRFCCPNCSAWMIEHRFRGRLVCHHCGYARPVPDHCPECGAVDALAGSGPGVERIAEEVSSLFPKASVEIMASDTVRGADGAASLVEAMQRGDIDILVGTQIIAKGHHFPSLTLVVIVDADVGLTGGDLRASERCFQLLYQVAGRAGREDKPGHVLVQTHLPEHPVIQALHDGDKDGFLRIECEERRWGGMPPFGKLAALVFAGPDGEMVKQTARKLASTAPRDDNVTVLGPAPAPLSLLRGRYRVRLLIKATHDVDLPAWLRNWLRSAKIPSKVRLQIDIDPVSFL